MLISSFELTSATLSCVAREVRLYGFASDNFGPDKLTKNSDCVLRQYGPEKKMLAAQRRRKMHVKRTRQYFMHEQAGQPGGPMDIVKG